MSVAVIEDNNKDKDIKVDSNVDNALEVKPDVKIDTSWGVTWFSGIFSTTSDILFNSWALLKDRIHKPATDTITHAEFTAMKGHTDKSIANQYLSIKGKAGVFLGGICPSNGKEYSCAGGVAHPNPFYCIGMDFDDGMPSDFVSRFKAVLDGYEYTAYTTITSTEAIPRWRIVVPVKSAMDVETRDALMRVIVNKIGWAGFDEKSLAPKQKMALPVQLQGETVHYEDGTGEFIEAEAYLDKEYPLWKSKPDLPRTPKELAKKVQYTNTKKSNLTPMEYVKKDKRGLIGTYLKAYSCADILENSGLYYKLRSTEKEERWSRNGDNGGGIVIYPNDTVTCYYASDKLAGYAGINSFSLNCLLNFDNNFKKALAAAKVDEKVRAVLLEKVKSLKPEDAGDWGDEDAYSPGFTGILERLTEYRHYKAVITDKEKQTGYFVVFDGRKYRPISLIELGKDIATVCRVAMAENPDLNLEAYIDNNAKANTLAKSLLAIDGIKTDLTEWDADLWKINARDCIIDIKAYILQQAKKEGITIKGWENEEATEPFIPHNPDYLSMKMLNVSMNDYTEEANTFLMKYLNDCIPDPLTMEYMITAIGSSLGDCSKDNKFCFLYGRVGRNGKTQFVNCLAKIFGDYFGTANADNFLMGRRDSGPNPELDRLRGKRVAIFSEPPQGSVLDGEKLKKWSGDSIVVTRSLNQQGGEWIPSFRLIIDTNSVLRSSTYDPAYRARLRIIPWDVSFAGREDPTIAWQLQSDKAVHAALLKLLLQGCYWWASNGFMLDRAIEEAPASVQDEINTYYEDMDDVEVFIKANVEITGNGKDFECMKALHEAYSQHGTDLSQNSFTRKLNSHLELIAKEVAKDGKVLKRGVGKVKFGAKARGWFGIKLKILTDSEVLNESNGYISPGAIRSMRNEAVVQDVPLVPNNTADNVDKDNVDKDSFDYTPF